MVFGCVFFREKAKRIEPWERVRRGIPRSAAPPGSFRQGGFRGREMRIATTSARWSRNDRLQEVRGKSWRGDVGIAPYERARGWYGAGDRECRSYGTLQEAPSLLSGGLWSARPTNDKKCVQTGRRDAAPYERARSLFGRPRGSPLRMDDVGEDNMGMQRLTGASLCILRVCQFLSGS